MPIRDNPDQHRYELDVEGQTAFAYYKLAGDTITFTHTEVPPALGGRGIGSQLAKGALDDVRTRGLGVVARCEFMGGYIAKHAEYGDLLR